MREMLRRHPLVIANLYRTYMAGVVTTILVGLTFGWFR